MTTGGSSDRVALVTGGSRGLGAASALALARRGVAVALTYRADAAAAAHVVASIRDAGGAAAAFPHELNGSDAAPLVDVVLERFGRLDSLILNAGVWAGGRLNELAEPEWWALVETNVRGTERVLRAALPHVVAAPAGNVVLVSSVVGVYGAPGDTAYATAKAGLVGLGRALAHEVAGSGTRVNVLAPGFVETDMTAAVSAAGREKMTRRTLLGRVGRPEEVAAAVVYLSEDATYTTGQVLCVDGGFGL